MDDAPWLMEDAEWPEEEGMMEAQPEASPPPAPTELTTMTAKYIPAPAPAAPKVPPPQPAMSPADPAGFAPRVVFPAGGAPTAPMASAPATAPAEAANAAASAAAGLLLSALSAAATAPAMQPRGSILNSMDPFATHLAGPPQAVAGSGPPLAARPLPPGAPAPRTVLPPVGLEGFGGGASPLLQQVAMAAPAGQGMGGCSPGCFGSKGAYGGIGQAQAPVMQGDGAATAMAGGLGSSVGGMPTTFFGAPGAPRYI